MISDPFCVVAPHADTFDQQGYKIGPIIEFIAASPVWMTSRTHSGNLMNDELMRERLSVSFSCLGFGG
jgi:hypothetical protein